MDNNIVIALVAAGSAVLGGAVTAVIGPIIKHRLEQTSARKLRQREQIERWRQMLLAVALAARSGNNPGQIIQVHPEFLSLEPHLSKETKLALYSESRKIVVGQSLPEPLEQVKLAIASIEQQWGVQE